MSGEIDMFVNGGPGGKSVDRTHIRSVVLGYYIDLPQALDRLGIWAIRRLS